MFSLRPLRLCSELWFGLMISTLFAVGQHPPVGPLNGEEFVGPFDSWVNAKALYGAAGDGIADDTQALQAALDNLGPPPHPSVLYLPAGVYRITRTLRISARMFVSVIGQHPDTTVIRWDGAGGGAMLSLNGITGSQISRITFDGSGSAAVGIDQSWDGSPNYFDTHNQYADDAFREIGIGIRGGHLGYGAADSVVLRCRFLRTLAAGVSVENWNALGWFIRDSFFEDNYVGVTNKFGAGNFHVYNSLFQRSVRADMEITNVELFSIRNNVSAGSGYFFLANPIGSAPNPITFQNNVILDPTIQAIALGNAGPVTLMDNVVRSKPGQPAVTVREGYTATPVNANVVSIGNTFTTASPYVVCGRLLAIDDTVTTPSEIVVPLPALAAVAAGAGRSVFEVPPGADAAAIQQTIDTAVAQRNGSRPVVHLPAGTYLVNRTIVIPKGSDVQLAGDGGYSALLWTGANAAPVLQIATASHAALRDFRIHGNARAKGILVDVDDQPGGLIFMDQAALSLTSQNNLLVEALDHTKVALSQLYHDSSQLSVKVVGGPLLAGGQDAESSVTIFGGGDGGNQYTYDVEKGGRLLAEDVWYEGAAPGFATLTGPGSLTLNGANIYNEDMGHGGQGLEIPPIILKDFAGSVSVLNSKIGHGGVSISGAGANVRVLGLGIVGPAGTTEYFQNSSPAAQAALLDSSITAPGIGSVAVADRTSNVASVPDFVRSQLSQVRNAQPRALASQPAGVTDLRVFRVSVEQSTVGIHLKAVAPTLSVAITSPLNRQSVCGAITVLASASDGSTVQFALDGGNFGVLTAGPYSLVLDTTKFINGPHVLTAEATDHWGNTAISAPVTITVTNAPPAVDVAKGTPLLTGFGRGVERNNYTGWVGMQFTVGPTALTVTSLGRIYLAGGNGSHVVKLVFLPAGTSGQIAYGSLPGPVTLAAKTGYFLVSLETSGGDGWYDYLPVTATPVTTIDGPVYWNGFRWVPLGIPSASYAPVSLLYTAATATAPPAVAIASPAANATVSGAAVPVTASAVAAAGLFITSLQFKLDGVNVGPLLTAAPYSLSLDTTRLVNGSHTLSAVAVDSAGNTAAASTVTIAVANNSPRTATALVSGFDAAPIRNNYSGFLGLQFTVAARALTVTSLGRPCLVGNSATHTVKLVRAGDGGDVPGTLVTISLSGCTPGQFVYGSLSSPVALRAYTSYYLVSQEQAGGDRWYDYTTVKYAGSVVVNGPVYWDGLKWFPVGFTHTGYIPLNLLFTEE